MMLHFKGRMHHGKKNMLARTAFVEKLQELKVALESRDSERASKLRGELKDLRSELDNTKSFRK